VRTLLERNLVTIKGRSEGPGRPLLYGTTDEFLRYFGLNSLDDLPREEELAAMLAARNEEKMREKGEGSEGAHSLTLKLPDETAELQEYDGFRIRNVITALSENLSN
jgi:segregation and condensation protein B